VPDFNLTEKKVLRYLHKRFLENQIFIERSQLALANGLIPEELTHITTRFLGLGLLEEVSEDGTYQIQGNICEIISELDHLGTNASKVSQKDVLISWSKKQSKEMASVFYEWLPKVVPGIKPWMSSKDIDKGKQWFSELQGFLGEATSCIICVTKENVRSPWIYYETGAIAVKKQDVLVCSYLIGIGTSMISDGPLAQYQCTEATKEDTLLLIKSLNKKISTPQDEDSLVGNFELKWPEFEQELVRILNLDVTAPEDFVETEADVLAGYQLSAEARKLLVTAAGADGDVMYCRYSNGADIQAGNVTLNDPSNRRSIATWEQAVNDLVAYDLLIDRSYKGEVFEVTATGFKVADVLTKRGET
jgi:hypothetical protein